MVCNKYWWIINSRYSEEKKKEAIPQSDMKEFIPWLSSSSTDVKLKVTELIGDLARISIYSFTTHLRIEF